MHKWFIDFISSNHFDNNKANVKYIFGFPSHQDPKIGQIIPRVPKMTPILELIMINTNDLGVGVRRVFLGYPQILLATSLNDVFGS